MSELIPKHGGYHHLKSFQIAQLVYDITVRFVEKYIDRFSRTRDQMVQAARSGVQNIAEGSMASATSKKTELFLTQVARSSLEELRNDYEDFLRHRKLPYWEYAHPLRQHLINSRCQTADDVVFWIMEMCGCDGRSSKTSSSNSTSFVPQTSSISSTLSIKNLYPEYSANAALVLITVACSLLDRQIEHLAVTFEEEGGFSERMYRIRKRKRGW